LKAVGYLINTKDGFQGEVGLFYDYLLGSDGLYIRASNDLLAVTINIANVEVRGLEPIKEVINLVHGKIPSYLYNLALSILQATPDVEQYVAIVWNGNSYAVRVPEQEGTGGHVNYHITPGTVLDMHCHTGEMPAEFSGIDDMDEQGLGLYAVAANLKDIEPTCEVRLGCHGYFLPLEKNEVFA
jgi:PRTRC genetic system protein A